MQVLKASADLWNMFVKLEVMHPDEKLDFKNAIHQIQNIMACRIVRKTVPGILYDAREDYVPDKPITNE
jgi:hypothetical protein